MSLSSLPKDVFIYLAWKYLNKKDRVALTQVSRFCHAVVWRMRQEYALIGVSRCVEQLQQCKQLAIYNTITLRTVSPVNLRRLQLSTFQLKPGDRFAFPMLEDMAIESTIQVAKRVTIELPRLTKLIVRQPRQGACLCALLGAVAPTLQFLQVTALREVRHFYGISEFWQQTAFPQLRYLTMQCFLPSLRAIADNMPSLQVTNCITIANELEALLLVELAPALYRVRSRIAMNNAVAEALFLLSTWYPVIMPLIKKYLAWLPHEYLGGQELYYSAMFQPLSVQLLHAVMPLQNLTREVMIHKLMSRQRNYDYLTLIVTEEEQRKYHGKKKQQP